MAITLLPGDDRVSMVGAGLGSGLGQGLEKLAQGKLKQMQESSLASIYTQAGVEPQYAQALAQLDPKQAQSILQNPSLLQELLVGYQEPQQQFFQDNKNTFSPLQSLSSLQGGADPLQALRRSSLPEGDSRSQKATQIAEGFKDPLQKLREEELAFKKENERLKAEEKRIDRMDKAAREAYKETLPDRREILADARGAKQDLQDLKRLEDPDVEGGVIGAAYNEFLKEAGLDIPALMNPESEEFLKIRQSFLRDAKKYFGARVTNFELEQFLKTIPDLSQSPEGRKRVIANLKRFNRLKILRAKSMRDVIRDNDGIPPLDLLEQTDERYSKNAKKIASQFKKDLKREVPEGSSALSTIAAKGAGKTLSQLGSAVPSAVLGGLSGALLGGATGGVPGALTGAARGAGLGAGANVLGGSIGKLLRGLVG